MMAAFSHSRFPLLPMFAKERARRGGAEVPPGWLKRGLLVDDEPMLLDFLRKVADQFWIEVVVAASCAQAREKIALERPFDFAILDYRLTNGVGVEIYRELATYAPSTQVVFLTGYNNAELQKQVHAIGPARIYSKEHTLNPKFMGKLFAEMGARARMPVG